MVCYTSCSASEPSLTRVVFPCIHSMGVSEESSHCITFAPTTPNEMLAHLSYDAPLLSSICQSSLADKFLITVLGILATIGEVQLFNGHQGSFFSWRPGFLFLFMAINPFVNLSMTLLIGALFFPEFPTQPNRFFFTAGRVWLMSRDIRHTSGSNLYHWYNRAWAVMYERFKHCSSICRNSHLISCTV